MLQEKLDESLILSVVDTAALLWSRSEDFVCFLVLNWALMWAMLGVPNVPWVVLELNS